MIQPQPHPANRYALHFTLSLLVAFASICSVSNAQTPRTGSITGVVLDAADDSPLKGATVRVRDLSDSTLRLLGAVSNGEGRFLVERVPIGDPLGIEVAYVGYDRFHIDTLIVAAVPGRRDLGEIRLAAKPAITGQIDVTAERPSVVVTADKTIYSVENNPSYTATSVSELLGQIPSVFVDQDGNISLRGDNDVTIMMDGRPMTMPADQRNKLLQSLPMQMVKDVEIRTNPGAQFDAKNRAGIINIVTQRKMTDALGGNVNLGTDSRDGKNAGGGLYYNSDALNGSLGAGYYYGPRDGTRTTLRINFADSIDHRDVGLSTNNSNSSSFYTYGQADYNLSASDLASVSFRYNHWGSDYGGGGLRTFFDRVGNTTGTLADTNSPLTDPGNSGGSTEISLLYRHTFNGDHKIDFNASYESDAFAGGSDYTSTYFHADGSTDTGRSSARMSSYDRSDGTFIATLDYNNPISDTLTLSFGAKLELNNLDNAIEIRNLDKPSGDFVIDTLQTNHYLPYNTVYALYGSVSYRIFQDLSARIGARLELAHVSAKYESGAEVVARDYTDLFPSGSLTWNITQQHSFTLSYRRSVALPDIDALNPTHVKWSDLYESFGNPDLDPEFTQTAELSFNTFWGAGNMISLSPYYSYSNGNIESSDQIVNGVTYSTNANYNGTYSIGSAASIAMRPTSWLNFRIGGSYGRKVNRGSAIPGDVHSAADGWSASCALSADIVSGLNFSINGFSFHPGQVGASQSSGYSFWGVGLRQRLLDNKLSVSLRLNDPFNTQKWENIYDTPEFHTESTSKWSSRALNLNVSYTFGTTPRLEEHRQEKTETKGGGGGNDGAPSSGGGAK